MNMFSPIKMLCVLDKETAWNGSGRNTLCVRLGLRKNVHLRKRLVQKKAGLREVAAGDGKDRLRQS
jgi:hypothetical protein